MTIDQIKIVLGIPEMQLRKSRDADGKETGWFRHWDNATRTNISVHQEVIDCLVSDRAYNNLSLQDPEQKVTGKGVPYTSYRIVIYTEQPDYRF
jgi:hypothetical protein